MTILSRAPVRVNEPVISPQIRFPGLVKPGSAVCEHTWPASPHDLILANPLQPLGLWPWRHAKHQHLTQGPHVVR